MAIISPYGIDPTMLPTERSMNQQTGFLSNLGKPTFMQPSPGVQYRPTPPVWNPEGKINMNLDPYSNPANLPPGPFMGDYQYQQKQVQKQQPQSGGNQMSDILAALANSISNFQTAQTTTTTAQTTGPQNVQSSSPSTTTTTNPNIGLK